MTTMMWNALLLLSILYVKQSVAFSTGSPICDPRDTAWRNETSGEETVLKIGGLLGGLTPMGLPLDKGPAGFRMVVSTTQAYAPGDVVTIILQHSNDTTAIKGLLLYADWPGNGRANGFVLAENDREYRYKTCGTSTTGTVTHISNKLKYPDQFRYRVGDTPGAIVFNAVVVGEDGVDDWHVLDSVTIKVDKEVVRAPRKLYSFTVPADEQDIQQRPFDAGSCMPTIGKTRLSSTENYRDGGVIEVPVGETYVVRLDTPELNKIIIRGTLIFDRTTDQQVLTVKARYIEIRKGGRLIVGTEQCAWPADKVVQFEMIGQVPADHDVAEDPHPERQLIRVKEGGELIMHGSHVGPTWTKLHATMDPGDSRVRTARPVNFRTGDSILVTSSDYDNALDDTGVLSFSETRQIAVRFSPHSFETDRGMTYNHFGRLWCIDNMDINDRKNIARCADGRAEVARLSRNIIIHGRFDALRDDDDQVFGARLLIEGKPKTLQLDSVEFYYAGWKDVERNAAITFELTGDISGAYIKRCSIHDTFNRGIEMRVTQGLLMTETVIYNTVGHGVAMLTAGEYNNMFYRNLVVAPKKQSMLYDDFSWPSGFYILNPTNDFDHNIVVGGYVGFWFSLYTWPRQEYRDFNNATWFGIIPERAPPGIFTNNGAHGQRKHGLNIYHRQVTDTAATKPSKISGQCTWIPQNATADWIIVGNQTHRFDGIVQDFKYNSDFYKRAKSVVEATPDLAWFITNFTVSKISEYGTLTYGYYGTVQGMTSLDVKTSVMGQGYPFWVNNGLFVAESDNVGNIQMQSFDDAALNGRTRFLNKYADSQTVVLNGVNHLGPVVLSNSHIYGYSTDSANITIAGESEILYSRKGVFDQYQHEQTWQAHAYGMGLRLFGSKAYVAQPINDALGSTLNSMWFDMDGSLTGTCGATVVPDHPFSIHSKCEKQEDYYVCPERNDFGTPRTFLFVDSENRITRSTKVEALAKLHRLGSTDADRAVRPCTSVYSHYDGTAKKSYYESRVKANVFTGRSYMIEFDNERTSADFYVTYQHFAKGEWINLAIPFPGGNTTVQVRRRLAYSSITVMTEADSKNELTVDTPYFFDKSKGLLWLHMIDTRGSTSNYPRLPIERLYQTGNTFYVKASNCPGGKCSAKARPPLAVEPPVIPTANQKPYVCETRGGPITPTRADLEPQVNAAGEPSKIQLYADALPADDDELKFSGAFLQKTDQTWKGSSGALWMNFTGGTPQINGIHKWKPDGLGLKVDQAHFMFRAKGYSSYLRNATRDKRYGFMRVYFRIGSTDICTSTTVTEYRYAHGKPDEDGWQQFAVPLINCRDTLNNMTTILMYNANSWHWKDLYVDDIYLENYVRKELSPPDSSWFAGPDFVSGNNEEEMVAKRVGKDSLLEAIPEIVERPPSDDILVKRGSSWQYSTVYKAGLDVDSAGAISYVDYEPEESAWITGNAPLGVVTTLDKLDRVKTFLDLGGILGESRPVPTTTAPPTTTGASTTTAAPTTTTTAAVTSSTMEMSTTMMPEPENVTALILFRQEFTVEPKSTQAKYYRLRVASNDYAHVYINGFIVDKDDDVHDSMYWNREIEVDGSVLVPFVNVIGVVLHNEWEREGEEVFFDLELEAMGVPDAYMKPPDAMPGQKCVAGTAGCRCQANQRCKDHLICQSGDVCSGLICRNGAPGCLCRTTSEAQASGGSLCMSGLVCYLDLCLRDSSCGEGLDEGCLCKNGQCTGDLECHRGYCRKKCNPGDPYCPCKATGECTGDDFFCATVDGMPTCVENRDEEVSFANLLTVGVWHIGALLFVMLL